MRHEKSMDLKSNTAGTPLYGVRHGKKSQTPQPELRQGAVCSNNSCVVHHDRGAGIRDGANGVGNMEGGAEMIKYTEVYPFNVTNEIKAGVNVLMLDKSNGTTQSVNGLSFKRVLKALDNKDDQFYFWKVEEVAEEPQATENEE